MQPIHGQKTFEKAAPPGPARIIPLSDYQEEKSAEEPFVKLFVENEPALRAFIFSQVLNWADMKEVLQETSVVLWQKFDQFEQGTDFRKWSFKIARFEVLNFLRKQKRSRLVFCDEVLEQLSEDDMAREGLLEDQRCALSTCLRKLATNHRGLIQDYYRGDSSMKELAAAYEKSPMALYQRLHRLRVVLLECIQKVMREEAADL